MKEVWGGGGGGGKDQNQNIHFLMESCHSYKA